jgi:hypothetical protein
VVAEVNKTFRPCAIGVDLVNVTSLAVTNAEQKAYLNGGYSMFNQEALARGMMRRSAASFSG